MFELIKKIRNWDSETAYFVFYVLLFGLPVIILAIYCYARLDFVRSYDTNPTQIETQK